MSTNKKTVVNCETGEIFEVNLTPEEIQINQLEEQKIQQKIIEIQEKETAKTELLERLGITEEEAKLLLQ